MVTITLIICGTIYCVYNLNQIQNGKSWYCEADLQLELINKLITMATIDTEMMN
jgi:hypothetical protein